MNFDNAQTPPCPLLWREKKKIVIVDAGTSAIRMKAQKKQFAKKGYIMRINTTLFGTKREGIIFFPPIQQYSRSFSCTKKLSNLTEE